MALGEAGREQAGGQGKEQLYLVTRAPAPSLQPWRTGDRSWTGEGSGDSGQ